MTVTFNISEVMEFTYGAEVDASNCRMYDSLNCKGCCGGGKESSEMVKKHVRFADEVNRCGSTQQFSSQYQKRDVGLCSCCKDASIENESHGVGKPILMYGIESPKFDSKSVHQTDFGPKTVPFKEMPPWHPILKDRWKMPDVPSFKKSTYQTDYTPPIGNLKDRKPVYLAPKKKVSLTKMTSHVYPPDPVIENGSFALGKNIFLEPVCNGLLRSSQSPLSPGGQLRMLICRI
ncbi:uncharacterized protein TNCV_4062311 [Trichonephila clavipes]|nr:uncharacterized protein TNCV_4062311 [Trichonephila clavipes]